jgi:hypothetical protein
MRDKFYIIYVHSKLGQQKILLSQKHRVVVTYCVHREIVVVVRENLYRYVFMYKLQTGSFSGERSELSFRNCC